MWALRIETLKNCPGPEYLGSVLHQVGKYLYIKTCQAMSFLLEVFNHFVQLPNKIAKATRVKNFSSQLILWAEQSFQLWKLWPGDGNLERCKDPIIGK